MANPLHMVPITPLDKKDAKRYALYDLATMPTTFDIAAWIVIVKTAGANHVRFVYEDKIASWKYPPYVAWKRFGNICVPMCLLAKMHFSVGPRVKGLEAQYVIGFVNQAYKEFGKLELLQPVTEVTDTGYVTITLRDSFRGRYRNSNVPEWQKFADYLNKRGERVIVLPECEQTPMDLLHRMKLYAGAKMNLGVNGGPMCLCLYSKAPYIMLNMCPDNQTSEKTPSDYDMRKLLDACGFTQGSQLAFRTDKQIIKWEPDTCANIIAAYEEMMDQQQEAA